ncbi:3-hydroxybutyrate dehydrogenase [soil metagenome]
MPDITQTYAVQEASTALVTGATSGIGKAIALGFAKNNLAIAINGFGKEEEIAAVLAELKAAGAREAVHIPSDMSKTADIEQLISSTQKRLGSLDVLVNNAGIQYTANVEDFPADKWDQIIAINLSSAFHTTRLALPMMKERNFGRIINIASVHGLVASVQKAAYVAAKHGIIGLTKVVALECAQQNITANSVCPGWVLTPLVEAQVAANAAKDGISYEQAVEKLLLEKQPSLRFVGLEELAALCLFLVSPGASSITGASMPIDGGWTAR